MKQYKSSKNSAFAKGERAERSRASAALVRPSGEHAIFNTSIKETGYNPANLTLVRLDFRIFVFRAQKEIP
ncbi:MAG: hypothetical protein LBR76_02730 [Oscillospiraceae bacterium]|jgi:hypothetical protein|nr:hypothetical protein [Oscillospiraceae bacterium]